VLVVDDDEIVRTTVASMLEELGYTVLLASNGREALALLEKRGNVDLLFTDVVMPGTISGRQLAERAVEIVPKLRSCSLPVIPKTPLSTMADSMAESSFSANLTAANS
jgi:CheY-like chemotaxis protein